MAFGKMRIALKWVLASGAAFILMQSAADAATISDLRANATTIGRYEKYELTFDLTGVSPSSYNPFRPETSGDTLSPAGVDVRADVVTPSGETKRVWGFYHVDHEYLGESKRYPGTGLLVPVSGPHWHVRYAPMEPGTHKITVRVTDGSGTVSSSQLTFNCVESGSKGFVRVADDGTRFVYSDGTPFTPFGMMAAYGVARVDAVTSSMKANGMNYLRRWLVNRDEDDIYRNLEGWGSYTSDTSVYRSGKRSAVENVTGSGTIVDQSFIACKPDTYYKASAYIKTSSSFNGEAAVYAVEARAGGSNSEKTGNSVGGGRDWTYSSVVFKTASDAEMIHFKPRVLSGSSGTVWVDDVGLHECDSSGNIKFDYNLVANPSLEEWTPAQLRMMPLARFEYLLEQCEASDIVVQPVIFDYRLWNKSDPTGFYAEFFDDWWTDSASIAQQQRVLRYLVARYGHFRSLFAWELTNEMDSSYTDVRGSWVAGHADFIRSGDPHRHMITNSFWSSPGDHEYAQMPEMDLSQVHYYINTEERDGGQGYPTWWFQPTGMSIETNTSYVASGSRALKASANGGTISDTATVYCRPNRSYTLNYKIRTSAVSGEASVAVRLHGGSSPGSGFTISDSGTNSYTSHSRTFTTGSTAVSIDITPELTGSSGTAWWDDIELIDNATGRPVLYNGGFESPPFGDDEFEWAVYHTMRSRQVYESGPNGTQKPWHSGEFGLMGPNYDLSYWARPDDTTKPRHDTEGIHVHNCTWAQFIASSALNTPNYWWVNEYIVANNLFDVWDGVSTFAGRLPFYTRGDSVCTDPCGVDVTASTSNSRIRLLGQKTSAAGYFWIQNREHSWSRVIREGQSPTATSATLRIPEFADGSYTVDWYDTYTGDLVRTETKSVSDGTLELAVSSLSTDIAAIVRSVDAQTDPQVSLTLAVDKTTALPGDVVTYTLSYANQGSGDATGIEISLPIPASTTYVSGSASDGGSHDSSTNSVKWTISRLAPGESGQCTAKVRVL